MDIPALKAFTEFITHPIPMGPIVVTVGELAIIVFVGSALVATSLISLVLHWTRRS